MIDSEFIRKGRTVKSLKPKYDCIQVIDANTGFINEINRNALRRDFKDYELEVKKEIERNKKLRQKKYEQRLKELRD